MIARLRLARERYGTAGLVPLAVRHLRRAVRVSPADNLDEPRGRALDRRLGLDTVQRVRLRTLEIDSENTPFAVGYEPTPVGAFHEMMDRLPIDPAGYTFVDLGCGKGRVLVMAVERGFGRVVGVEFAAALCDVARTNVDHFRERAGLATPVTIECLDVVDFRIPPGDVVVYLYNPFTDAVLSRVVANLAAAFAEEERDLFVVYFNPRWRRMLDREPWLRVHAQSIWAPDWYVIYRAHPTAAPVGS